ncbi:hypothetical protein K493DRAFT_318984 [Basidiobolus meristosporus CBS 931.73]|uniref:Carbohydrate-binding module family 19 domain-containing protein n=1 Tax=Basidiobolus meristosporus CBS 931.73 TaxID=1314790 RepID=A0A1Y1XTU4_9FUNG|nr:hypothetical protein K493DRAFT_318984 [Basidiobolus meristosporus CBS 931.73]|eukprot:ORX89095.1 hypothetical protein K493DRAFT_318984 [Basidiobolus meristosporus CBS 931.73]
MHFATRILATAAAAMAVVSASDFFPFEYPSDCITSCSLQAGKKCWSSYTQDESDPNFIQSFSCLCDSSNPGNGNFMMDSLKCLTANKCEEKDIMASMALQGPICEWYNQHKNDPKPTTTEKPEPTTTEKPEPTTTEKPEPTTTEKPEPTTTEKPEPTTTEKPEPTTTEKPEPTTTEKPEPTTTEEPETSTTEKPEPTTTEKPESTNTDKPESTTADKPESTTTEKPEPTTTEKPEPTTTEKPVETTTSVESAETPKPTTTTLPSCEPVTVTTTVYVTDDAPKPTDTTCEHGAYQCVDSGKSGDFTVCVHGSKVANSCAPGTVCKNYAGSIVCDWA